MTSHYAIELAYAHEKMLRDRAWRAWEARQQAHNTKKHPAQRNAGKALRELRRSLQTTHWNETVLGV